MALSIALRPIIKDIGGAARVYYVAPCTADAPPPEPYFPALKLRPPADGTTGLPAVRRLLQQNPDVSVTSDQSGMLRITIGAPTTAILQTRIQSLTLDTFAQYDGLGALETIKESKEIFAAEESLKVTTINSLLDILWDGPKPGKPHLPKLLRAVTVDEALDSVARTFKGIVFYGVCDHPNAKGWVTFSLDYVDHSAEPWKEHG